MIIRRNTSNCLTITGPFESYSGFDTRELLHTGYVGIQTEICQKLNQLLNSGTWHYPEAAHRSNKLAFDVDNYQGITFTPKYFIGFRVDIDDRLRNQIAVISRQTSDLFELSITEISVRFYDFGAGNISFHGTYLTHEDLSYEQVRNYHEQLSSAITSLGNELISDLNTKLTSVIPERYLFNALSSRKNETHITWMHRVFYLQADVAGEDDLLKSANEFVSRYDHVPLTDASITPGIHFFPSVGNSLVMYTDADIKSRDTFRSMEQIIEFLNPCWQATSSIDKQLFMQMSESGRNNAALNVRDLEKKYNVMGELLIQVTLFKSILHNQKINLSPQESLIWDCIAKAWKLDSLLEMVTTKLESMHSMSQSILERVENKHTNRLNYLVFIFTVISFVTIVLQIIDFVQQGIFVPNLVRTGTVVMLTVVVILSVRKLRNWLFG